MSAAICLALLACCLALAASLDQPPYITYDQLGGKAYTVTADERSFMINGQRTLLLGGSFHYPRASPGDWPLFFEKAKQDGLNHIQTYVFWSDQHVLCSFAVVVNHQGSMVLVEACCFMLSLGA
jgi:hypothetical protein